MSNNTTTIQCTRCNNEHVYNISQEDLDSGLSFNFACLNIKRLPRISRFRIDFTKNVPCVHNEEASRVSQLYGSNDIEGKIERKNQINDPKLWLIYDFDKYFEEIINAYICGSFFPVATSCTALAERLTNLFILKMRNLHDKALLDDKSAKYVYSRDQNWQSFDSNMNILEQWGLLNEKQKGWFNDLLKIRNKSIHFQTTFDPQRDSLIAIQTLHKIIDSYFSPFERKDILWVFEIPGEIWAKEEKLSDPFVKAFVLPCCTDFASCGALNNKGIYHENDAVIGTFSETDFIRQRKEYQSSSATNKTALTYEPTFHKNIFLKKELIFRVI